jgi:hypothetical protein
MKGSYKNKIVICIFLFCIVSSLIAIGGCAAGKQASATTPTKIKEKKEILIVEDIGGGLPFQILGWCGNTALLIDSDEFGKEWVDLNGNRVTISKESGDYPIGCPPDGKWVLYKDRDSARVYKNKWGKIPENIVDEGPGWHGFVMDLYRYEVTTGRRQKFAVVRDDSGSLVSPDGSKVLLGNRHDSAMEMPEPRWEAVWLTNEWGYGETRWFEDSSGIVTMIWGNGHSLGVEFFGEGGWSKEFSLDMLRSDPRSNVSIAAVDEDNVLHFVTMEDYPVGDSPRKVYNFFRCKIKYKDLVCSLGDGLKEEKDEKIRSLELLPNGDVIFEREEDNCIRRVKHRKLVAECIAHTRDNDEVYIGIDLIEISPDGKWMAFRRSKLPPPGDRWYAYQYDLFVKELSED